MNNFDDCKIGYRKAEVKNYISRRSDLEEAEKDLFDALHACSKSLKTVISEGEFA